MKLKILLGVFIFVIMIMVIVILLYPQNTIISQILPLVAIIPVLISIVFLDRQSKYTERMIETTLRPHVCVGIISFGGRGLEGDLSKKYTNPHDRTLLDTRIILKNFSNIQAFVWTKLKLEINDKETNKHIRAKDYCSGEATWELDPNVLLHPYLLEESILDYKNQKINISIDIYFSHIRKLPENPDWTELTAYSFRENGQWLKNNLGVQFFIQGLYKNVKAQ